MTEFVKGLFVNPPRENAPDFVKGSISIKTVDLAQWLQGCNEDRVNLDILVSREGKWYAKINDWKPEKKPQSQPKDFQDSEDIPF